MRSKAFLLFLLPCTLCAGQSVLTTPTESTQSVPGSTAGQGPATGATQAPSQAPRQAGENGYIDNFTPTPRAPATAQIPATARIVGPLTQKSEFERFVEDATGRTLPVYGRQLFDEVPTTFAPVEHIPVPADYVLGPGDELLIRAWGKIDLDSRVTVDRNGQIYLPKVGSLTVAGLRYEQVEGYLHSAIGALFKDFQLNVAMGQLRSIQIFVLGSARQPGGYTVSSLSTLVDALFASGNRDHASYSATARGPDADRIRYLRSDAEGRQIPRCPAAPRRCNLLSFDWSAGRYQWRYQRTRYLRIERRNDGRRRSQRRGRNDKPGRRRARRAGAD